MKTDLVKCAVCGKEMSAINNRHLASHAMSANDYKERFPGAEMLSEKSKRALTERSIRSNADRKGKPRSDAERASIRAGIAAAPTRIAHNKGRKMSVEQREKLSRGHLAAFASGDRVHWNIGKSLSEETKKKISQSLAGREIGPAAARKAVETKKARGYDLAPMRGRKHSEETKRLIGLRVTQRFDVERETRREPMLERIADSGLELLNSITDEVFRLRCLACMSEFTRTVQMFQPSKWHSEACDQCFPISPVSEAENEVAAFCASLTTVTRRSDMETIAPFELDIVAGHVAVEYCGLYWHSELAGKSRFYHQKKLDATEAAGLRLITIFEDEWKTRRPIVESMLSNVLRGATLKLDARKCEVRAILAKEGAAFIESNHLQGRGRANEYYGLFHGEELVSVMSFSNNEISRKSVGWDINRFCSKLGTNIRGAGGKLFKRFLVDHNPDVVVSYADLRWGTGKVYGQLGFSLEGRTLPNYWYFRPNELKRYHRYGLRKNPQDDQSLTEWENRKQQSWNRIWDCGHAKWIWRK